MCFELTECAVMSCFITSIYASSSEHHTPMPHPKSSVGSSLRGLGDGWVAARQCREANALLRSLHN